MARTQLIIDCDPGVDDAIALLLALASPAEIEVIAITTVSGNVGAELTARNACIIREIAHREDVPIYLGAAQPLVRPPVGASDFHGASGLGDYRLFEPKIGLAKGRAALAIIEEVMRRPAGAVKLAVTGPMTNIALALRLAPEIAPRLAGIVAMGGASLAGGNITPMAEYNIFADPHAAHVVFASGVPITLHGLDLTHQVRATPQHSAAIRTIGTRQAAAMADFMDFSIGVRRARGDLEGAPMHDPCTIAWLLRPELFSTRPADIKIDIAPGPAFGHTEVVSEPKGPANAQWAIKADAEGFFALVSERLSK